MITIETDKRALTIVIFIMLAMVSVITLGVIKFPEAIIVTLYIVVVQILSTARSTFWQVIGIIWLALPMTYILAVL